MLDEAKSPIGYVYLNPDGFSPLAARRTRQQLLLIRLAAEVHGSQGAVARVQVPGVNGTVLRALLERGFRIDHANLMMTSRPFGRFDRYLPSGGTML